MFSVNSKQIKMPSPYVLPNLWKNNFWYIIFGIAIVYFPYHFLIGSVLLKDISFSIMSGQRQVRHVHSTDQTSVIVDDQDNGKYNEEEKSNRLETAVIILSSLIPSHPSLWMLENVIKSLENLDGLHPMRQKRINWLKRPKSWMSTPELCTAVSVTTKTDMWLLSSIP